MIPFCSAISISKIKTLCKLLDTLESVINSEERFHVGEPGGKLGFLQGLLASLTKNARGSSTMISPNFTKENLPEAYQAGYELSEDLQVHRAPEGGIYHFDFKRRLDRYLDGSQTETVTIATAIWRHDIRGPSKRVRNLEEAEARIAELQSQFEQSQRELTETRMKLSMTENKLSTTREEFSAFRDQCSRDNSRLTSLLKGAYGELWPGSIPTARSSGYP
ncbi:hypothetical protein FFLO_06274 [Filobasidium floriforme]|uniref:Uncharacterized protein n=1 Tax=Filobasidium floriforme TaxID=5210 RepID=A0A8K0JFP9_9TREE|nr:hypothetical protein FFLO_06274 [Filobasidium floriforme]